eukprot:326726-Pyramimonas_sp.AAC.1
MNAAPCQQLQKLLLRFARFWQACDGHFVFKRHVLFHVAEFVAERGNPRSHWTCAGEQENRLMGTAAKSPRA